jgi:hypothetical protein
MPPFPPAFADRVWDSLLLEGDKTLFRAALALLRLAQPTKYVLPRLCPLLSLAF